LSCSEGEGAEERRGVADVFLCHKGELYSTSRWLEPSQEAIDVLGGFEKDATLQGDSPTVVLEVVKKPLDPLVQLRIGARFEVVKVHTISAFKNMCEQQIMCMRLRLIATLKAALKESE